MNLILNLAIVAFLFIKILLVVVKIIGFALIWLTFVVDCALKIKYVSICCPLLFKFGFGDHRSKLKSMSHEKPKAQSKAKSKMALLLCFWLLLLSFSMLKTASQFQHVENRKHPSETLLVEHQWASRIHITWSSHDVGTPINNGRNGPTRLYYGRADVRIYQHCSIAIQGRPLLT